jgi:predicted dehydrogenase
VKKYNLAILGAGNIAGIMASTVTKMPQITPYGVGSRDLTRAKNFAQKYGFMKAFGSYEEMLQDPEIDIVYVATPNSHHYKHSLMCLEHKKHVLCEKSFTANASQAEKLIGYAKANNLLIAEALWTRYMPMAKKINEIIDSGVIGNVVLLSANLGSFKAELERVTSPELGGGALLTVGVYPINFASMILGDKILKTVSAVTLFDTGVDSQGSITLCFEGGRMAVLYFSVVTHPNCQGFIYGEKGYLVVDDIINPKLVRVYNFAREEIAVYHAPEQLTGYEYEVESVIRNLENGLLECPEMPHGEIVRIMKLMDGLRKEWGVIFPPEIEKV